MDLDEVLSRLDGYADTLAKTRRDARVSAAIAVRNGALKTDVARRLGISRPTLNTWLATVAATPGELAEVKRSDRT